MRGFRRECGELQSGDSGQVSASPQEHEGQEAAPAQARRQGALAAGLGSATLALRGDKGSWYGIPTALVSEGLLEGQRGLKPRNRTHDWRLGCLVMMSTPAPPSRVSHWEPGLLGEKAGSRSEMEGAK